MKRASISTRTMDTLLGDKGELDRVVYETARLVDQNPVLLQSTKKLG